MLEEVKKFVDTLQPNSKVVGELILSKAYNLGFKTDKEMFAFEKIAWELIDEKFPKKVEVGNFGLGRTVVLL